MGLCYQRARVFLLLIFINDSFRIKAKPNEHVKVSGKDGYFMNKNRLTVL